MFFYLSEFDAQISFHIICSFEILFARSLAGLILYEHIKPKIVVNPSHVDSLDMVPKKKKAAIGSLTRDHICIFTGEFEPRIHCW